MTSLLFDLLGKVLESTTKVKGYKMYLSLVLLASFAYKHDCVLSH